MKIEIKDYQGVKMIALSGEVDMYTSPALREEMMALINKG
jgi:anti-anti-sigma regulatory factor